MLDKILSIVGVIVGFIQLIKQFIELVEVPGHGEEKKQAVLELIGASYDHINSVVTLPISKDKVLALSDNFIDILVRIYNILGIFRHGTAK